ncbi:BCL2/adenovirus E1B 19 kDa protein-interacting protein 3 [Acromyrmex echinatior]|uniref:BCL2/adenovirus E1B 19 kDa protein-interacting protein 3 n=1 Tax=Acromyrmex echinatior TaxID=103372 RepID=F4WEB2_ACREC|nr:BCL2/adenovirus E1B 19 kDa protein-interacting protein 3 [Acromyrmex echinatior]
MLLIGMRKRYSERQDNPQQSENNLLSDRCCSEGELLEKNTDWIYEWSSRPDQAPPKDWKFKHPLGSKRKTYSIRTAKVGKNGLFSKEVIYTLFFTNLLSLLIGTGLGVLLTRRGLMMSRVAIE